MTKITRVEDPKDPLNKDKFKYIYADGTIVNDKELLEWIDKLRIPPAWTNVVIFYTTSAKQTCCGYDPAGRLQCLYSQAHVAKARKKKYCDLIEFGTKLPKIQNDINAALGTTRFTKLKVIALIIKIVMSCNFRLGTLTYEAQNESYGITTIRRQHIKFDKSGAAISFIGKKGVLNECVVTDPICIKVLKELVSVAKQDDHVMMYTVGGEWFHIKHTDVNSFLKSYGSNITSKDFRTFQSNMLLIDLLKEHNPTELTQPSRKRTAVAAIKQVAEIVHNTPAICKKDYIDSDIIELYILHPIKYRSKFITPTASSRILFMNWLREKCP